MAGKGSELLCGLYQPLQYGIGVALEHPRRPPDAQAFGSAGDDAHDELDRGTLAMQERAEGLENITATGNAEQLPPGTAPRMAIGPEIAPAHPATIGTGRVGAEMR